jgi:hypothetical protein
MQYALLIYRQPGDTDALAPEQLAELSREYLELRHEAGVSGGAGLHPPETATTVRVDNGRALVTDGPFADTKEYFAGFYLVDAADLDAATEIAVRIPAVRFGAAIEIRPLLPPQPPEPLQPPEPPEPPQSQQPPAPQGRS